MFKICDNKGFHITLPNGVTISTQFGGGNYCQNYNDKIGYNTTGKESNDAELGIWDSNRNWITGKILESISEDPGDGQVVGNVNIELWIKIFNTCVKYAE